MPTHINRHHTELHPDAIGPAGLWKQHIRKYRIEQVHHADSVQPPEPAEPDYLQRRQGHQLCI